MFTIRIKGRRNPKDLDLVKLTLIFHKTGFARVSKEFYISGLYKDWSPKAQSFRGDSPQIKHKNPLLRNLKLKYLEIAERWEAEKKDWTPVELSHYFNKEKIIRDRYITVPKMLDLMVEKFLERERFKNGWIITSQRNAEKYRRLKKQLTEFTHNKYRREFSKYLFRDITEKFLLEFAMYEQQRGARNGNLGGVQQKLKILHATFVEAKHRGVYNVRLSVFKAVRGKVKGPVHCPKSVSQATISAIEQFDRQRLKEKEQLYLDMFLFSYYAGGMSAIDTCFLTADLIKDDMILYERMKCDKRAQLILVDKAKVIIDRYRTTYRRSLDYIFPVFTRKHNTELKMYERVKRLSSLVCQLLRKICDEAGITETVVWSSARGSFISRLIDEGYHPLQIAEQTGNSPHTIYKYYYSNTNKEAMREEMNRIL